MPLPLSQLATHLQHNLRPLYTLYGDEPLQLQEAADAIRAAARANGYTERSIYTAQGSHFDWSQVLATGSSLNLFADRQLLELRIPSGKPGKDGSTALQQLATQTTHDADTLILITLPRLDAQTRKSTWFAALDTQGITIQIDPIERSALPGWIVQRLARQNQHVACGAEGQRTLQFFAERVEGNLLAAHQEIQKLGLLYPAGELHYEQVERAVLNVARYDVFKLSDAILSGNLARVTRMMDGLQAEGTAEVLVHWALAEDIRNLYRARQALANGQPLPMVLRGLRIWGQKEKQFEHILGHLTPVAATRLLHAAHLVDSIVKGLPAQGWPSNGWQALRKLATEIVQALQRRAHHH